MQFISSAGKRKTIISGSSDLSMEKKDIHNYEATLNYFPVNNKGQYDAKFLLLITSIFIFSIIMIAQSHSLSNINGKIEIIRDQWGIPHVYSDTDEGAMYGLGYATAEDRCFQMYYMLRIVQGRLAEVIGDVKTIDGGDTALNSDRHMRIFGFYRSAQKAVKSLEPETLALLQAYSDGVNRYIKDNAGDMHYLFDKYKLNPEPWTPADCIAIWWNFGKWFANNGLGDKISPDFKKDDSQEVKPVVDEDAAVVKRDDVSDEWVAEINKYMENHGLKKHQGSFINPPKFSHAWVIGGSKTTTGSAVLVSDPQTPVWNPSLLYEFHVSGKTFNARGIGTAGCPIILIGFSKNTAWGVTALGGDQADLFLLKTDSSHPNQYEYDSKWKDMKILEETIIVKNGNNEKITVKETHHGPIVNSLINNLREGQQVAVKCIPMCDTERDNCKVTFEMMRAKDAYELLSALADWRFPTANAIFGDSKGNIGYRAIGTYPVRSAKAIQWGDYAHDGSSSEWEWQEMIPANLLPQAINPKDGYLVTANHRVIQSFYELPLGHSTGAFGETDRGMRIKEKIKEHLLNSDKFTPEDVLAVQYDAVSISKRIVIQLGFHIRDVLKGELSGSSLNALKYLEDWYKNGAQSNTFINGTALVNEMRIIFRAGFFPLARTYGGGASGLANFAKAISNRLRENPNASLTSEEVNFADTVLKNAWDSAVNRYGSDTGKWQDKTIWFMQNEKMRYYQSLEGFPSLDERFDISYPILKVTDGGTIWSQRSQAYTQYVPLHDADLSMTILPIGQSERPGSPYRFSTYADWSKGVLHDAPISRERVEIMMVNHILLSLAGESKQQFVIEDENGNEILPGCAPMDETLREKGIRKLIQKDCSPEEVNRIIEMLLGYVKGNKSLTDELIGSFQRMIYVEYGNEYARQRMGEIVKSYNAELPPQRPEKFKKKSR